PTRIAVAPSSIATSKSALMPIDSSGSPAASPSSRSARNQGRACSGSAVAGGTAMSPRTSRRGSARSASSAGVTSAGAKPPCEGLADALGGGGLGEPDQQNVLRPAPRPARRARHPLTHALEIGPYIVHEPYRRF